MLDHGGRLRAAAERYGIPLPGWIDLSTGINPIGYSVPPLPPAAWQRLPEAGDGLEAAAAAYYGSASLLPVAGSQAAIQMLPRLFPPGTVACISPLYAEHPQAWARAGHKPRFLANALLSRAVASLAPVVVVCNPNNPTADRHPREAVVAAARELSQRGAWLVVDEAFADPDPELSVAALAGSADFPRLVVLRSLGKFFGLAGARVGFVAAAPELLARLAEALGPWAVAGPSRAAAAIALADTAWQAATRQRLRADSARLAALLTPLGPVLASPLFASVAAAEPEALADFLARRGILVRSFATPPLLRFGLPGDETQWRRLAAALSEWPPCPAS